MILLALPLHKALATALETVGPLEMGKLRVARFPNLELYAEIGTPVSGSHCVVLGSMAPPDGDLLRTLLVSHTLRKEGARRITALLPYLGYARQDRDEAGKSLGVAWAGTLLRATGVDDIVTIDVHSPSAHDLIPIPLHSLSPAPLLGQRIATLGWTDATVVAPDEGARSRANDVRTAAGIERPVAWLVKRRTPQGITHSTLHGMVGRHVIVIDDILDTGGTLISACEVLAGAGAQEIIVMVTHGLFTEAR